MSFTFTITCNTTEEIERVLDFLKGGVTTVATTQVETATAVTCVQTAAGEDNGTAAEQPKRRGRPPRSAVTEPASPATTDTDAPQGPTSAVQEAKDEPEKQPDKKVTLDDARSALRGLQSRIGEDDMATPIALLKDFGATRISEVKAEDYAAFVAACDKAA